MDNLYDMLDFLREQTKAVGFDEAEMSKIELACEEALVNIINYGYPGTQGNVEIECPGIDNDKRGIKILLKDTGIPYNPLSNTPKTPTEEATLGGYGIFFITNLMDEVTYNHDGQYNILSLVKYCSN